MTYKYLGSFILLITLLVAGCRSDTYGTDDENAADTVGAPTSNTSVDAAPYGGSRFPIDARMAGRRFISFHLDGSAGDVLREPFELLEGHD